MVRPYKQARYQCRYCKRPFVFESRMQAHKCTRMKREEELKTRTGQRAWAYYREWMHCSNRRVINIESFLESRYYPSFMRFAKYIKDLHISHPNDFIKLMVDKDYMPSMWTSSEIYSIYLEGYDRRVSPQDQVADSINSIDNACEDKGVETKDFFNTITPSELINLLRKKKISPWLLLRSNKFIEMHNKRFSQEQKLIMRTFMHVPVWKKRFKDNQPFVHKVVDKLIVDMGL